MSGLSHLDDQGQVSMVDVGAKPVSARKAVASSRIRMLPEVLAEVRSDRIAKGNVLATARIAAIMAAKRTAGTIPLCHSLPLDLVQVDFELGSSQITIRSTVMCRGQTGVEMEALVAASVAALTIYDMCKALDRRMVIEQVRLEEKSGGKSGHFVREDEHE